MQTIKINKKSEITKLKTNDKYKTTRNTTNNNINNEYKNNEIFK